MKRILWTVLAGTAIALWAIPAGADPGRAENSGEGLRIGVVLGENILKGAVPVSGRLPGEASADVEGSLVFRIGGKLVRVTKDSQTVVEILDDSRDFRADHSGHGGKKCKDGWKKAEERKRENRKKFQEKRREQAKRDAEHEREWRKRADEQARQAREARREWVRELEKSQNERGEEVEPGREIRL